mmetsp:Transcript_9915/g.25647  ORF Transcript_9915/g.25647 Transcript_9915/m.25647 type:complete len:303 (+) Transcript_9915:896-1804(+)
MSYTSSALSCARRRTMCCRSRATRVRPTDAANETSASSSGDAPWNESPPATGETLWQSAIASSASYASAASGATGAPASCARLASRTRPATSSRACAIRQCEPRCSLRNTISFRVSVPVLSVSRYSMPPSSSAMDDERTIAPFMPSSRNMCSAYVTFAISSETRSEMGTIDEKSRMKRKNASSLSITDGEWSGGSSTITAERLTVRMKRNLARKLICRSRPETFVGVEVAFIMHTVSSPVYTTTPMAVPDASTVLHHIVFSSPSGSVVGEPLAAAPPPPPPLPMGPPAGSPVAAVVSSPTNS